MTLLINRIKISLMNRLFTFLFLIFFSFSAPSFADDIKDLQIEGISLGDSLLDHLSKKQIITEIEINKPSYDYLTEKFGEVYLFNKFEIYDHLSFFVKPNDKSYKIYLIKASIKYDDKIKQCYAKQKEIVKEFSALYKNTIKYEKTATFPFDPTGKSNSRYVQFSFDSGDAITVSCKKYEKSVKIKYKFVDALSVEISLKEMEDWLTDY